MNDVVDVQTLEEIYKIFEKSQVTKKRWFGTRPRTSYIAKLAAATVNYEMMEIFTEGFSTPLVLPDSAENIINRDNGEIFTELKGAWNEINNYLKARRERRYGFGVGDLDPRTIFWQELKERFREISFMSNKAQILIELDLVIQYLTEVTSNPANLFPTGIDEEKTTRGTITKVKDFVQGAIDALNAKDEADPLPVLCDNLAKDTYNMLELLLQYCFIQLRGDETRSDFSSIATFASLRDLVASSTKKIYSKSVSQLLSSLAHKDKSKILFPSGTQQYKVSHRAKRTDEVLRFRLKAMCDEHNLLNFASTQELEKTPYAKKQGQFKLKFLPNAIRVPLDGKNKIIEINLQGSNTDIDKAFISDDVLLTHLVVLIGMLENFEDDVLMLEDAQASLNIIGQAGVLANFAGNALAVAQNVIMNCEAAIEIINTIHKQCVEAERSKLRQTKYTPLNRDEPLEDILDPSDTWLKNHEACKKIVSSLNKELKANREKALKLRDKAIQGLDPEEKKKVSMELNHFSGVTALLTEKKNIQQPQCILDREDPNGIYWKIKAEDYALLKDLTQKIFVTLLVKQLPDYIRNDLLKQCNHLSISNYDLIMLLTNNDFMRNSHQHLDKSNHLKLVDGGNKFIIPSNDNILVWILKLFIQKNVAKSNLTENYKRVFADTINPDLIKILPDIQVFLIGYILGQIGSTKPSQQFNQIVEYFEWRIVILEEAYQKLLRENINKPGIVEAKAKLDAVQNYLGLLGIAQGIPTNAPCNLSQLLVALNHHRIQLTVDAIIHPEMEGSNIGSQLEQLVSNKLHHGKPQHALKMYERSQPGPSTPPVPRDPSSSTSREPISIFDSSRVPPLKPPAPQPPAKPPSKPPAAAGVPQQQEDDDIEGDIELFATMEQRKKELEVLFRAQGKKFTAEQLSEYTSVKSFLQNGAPVNAPPQILRTISTPDSLISHDSSGRIIIATTASQPNLSTTLRLSESTDNVAGLRAPPTPVPTPIPAPAPAPKQVSKPAPSPTPVSPSPKQLNGSAYGSGSSPLPPSPSVYQRERSDSNLFRFVPPQPPLPTPPPQGTPAPQQQNAAPVVVSQTDRDAELRRRMAASGFVPPGGFKF